jgi:hypothetical protein
MSDTNFNTQTGNTTVYVDKLNVGNATVIFANLPTTDPHVVGQGWNNSGVFTISAG